MKYASSNICKFVTEDNTSPLKCTNFILEQNAPKVGKTRITNVNTAYLAIDGKGVLQNGENTFRISSGMLFFTFSGVPFSINNTDGLVYMYISFDGNRADELFSRFGISRNVCVFDGFGSLIPFWQDCISRGGDGNLDLISEAVLLYTLSAMSQSDVSGDSRLIGDILKYMEESFTDAELSLTTLSERFGYNPKYISRLFSTKMGVSFSAHLRNVRVRHAVFLMEQGITSIKNVSILSGYSDPLYFSKVFKSAIGMSPSDYVEKVLAKSDT